MILQNSRIVLCVGLLTLMAFTPLAAQDDFGFGFGDEDSDAVPAITAASAPAVKIAGEVSGQLLGYVNDFDDIQNTSLGDVFSGKLNFSASGSNADAVLNFNLTPVFDNASPLTIDEAYIRGYFGALHIEAGLRKLTWGRADSLGPMDVINPLDYSDLSAMTDIMGIKIARPMLHASYSVGSFSKIEAVFVPWFQGVRFAQAGRWAPAQMTALPAQMSAATVAYIAASVPANLAPALDAILSNLPTDAPSFDYPPTTTLEYAQAGVRFTTTIGSSDLGAQYYFGRLPRPAVTLSGVKDFWQHVDPVADPPYTGTIAPIIAYNWYHQVGVDFARVIAGFNLRAELAANLTDDLAGDDGAVYNPSVGWSLGFDRDLFAGINLNLQANESVRLFHDKIGDNIALDAEAGSDMTSTRITAVLSKKLFRDELELKVTGIVGIEDSDFYILPGMVWSKGDLVLELSGGVFGGDEDGELGQYHRNSYVKTVVKYSF
jgi:hypothetical protein